MPPATSQSLRARRGVAFTIDATATHEEVSHGDALHHRSQIIASRLRRRQKLPPTPTLGSTVGINDDTPSLSASFEETAFHHLQELVPGLYLGASDAAVAGLVDLGWFTHIIAIVHPSKCYGRAGSFQLAEMSPDIPQTLVLTVPPSSLSREPEGFADLTAKQLTVGRDFLSLSLSYCSISNPINPRYDLRPLPCDAVRVLILGPSGL
ncbi:hypothetical protein HGRIS_001811 [Hohenbuehelia grisea]|uniref:Uncharacterized protein n=1 Tax=Hohenbuehelia grisea TaxID=104357 RepID=A0ABR3JJI7_9AGAR